MNLDIVILEYGRDVSSYMVGCLRNEKLRTPSVRVWDCSTDRTKNI